MSRNGIDVEAGGLNENEMVMVEMKVVNRGPAIWCATKSLIPPDARVANRDGNNELDPLYIQELKTKMELYPKENVLPCCVEIMNHPFKDAGHPHRPLTEEQRLLLGDEVQAYETYSRKDVMVIGGNHS